MDTDGVTGRGEKWSASGSRGGGLFMHQWPTREGDGKWSVHVVRRHSTVREVEGDHMWGDRVKDRQDNRHPCTMQTGEITTTTQSVKSWGKDRWDCFSEKRWLRIGCEVITETFSTGKGDTAFRDRMNLWLRVLDTSAAIQQCKPNFTQNFFLLFHEKLIH